MLVRPVYKVGLFLWLVCFASVGFADKGAASMFYRLGGAPFSCSGVSGLCLTGTFDWNGTDPEVEDYWMASCSAFFDGGFISHMDDLGDGGGPRKWCNTPDEPPPPPDCDTDVIPGGELSGGGSGIYNIAQCAYNCEANMSMWDGNTSFADSFQCTGLGVPYTTSDPADYGVPEQGCVVDTASGKEMCLSENEGCYVVEGKEECPSPAEVCGIQNGAWACINPEQEGCGYFNGEKICYSPDGSKVDSTSPDHPDNGGNLDGDETNDLYDARDPTEGGDPDNQTDSTSPATTDADRASETTLKKILTEQKKTNQKLDGLTENANDTGIVAGVDKAGTDAINATGIDSLIDGMGTNPYGDSDLLGVPGTIEGLLPAGTCTSYSTNVLGFGVFEITCEDTALLRTILAWVFYVLTAIYLFQLLTTPVEGK